MGTCPQLSKLQRRNTNIMFGNRRSHTFKIAVIICVFSCIMSCNALTKAMDNTMKSDYHKIFSINDDSNKEAQKLLSPQPSSISDTLKDKIIVPQTSIHDNDQTSASALTSKIGKLIADTPEVNNQQIPSTLTGQSNAVASVNVTQQTHRMVGPALRHASPYELPASICPGLDHAIMVHENSQLQGARSVGKNIQSSAESFKEYLYILQGLISVFIS